MSKKEGKGLKSFNKGFQVPDTYIIIFLVVVVAALLTFLVPKGFYETQDISYMINGVEKTRTVIKDGSFQYLTDDAGNVVTEGVAPVSYTHLVGTALGNMVGSLTVGKKKYADVEDEMYELKAKCDQLRSEEHTSELQSQR